MSPLDTFMFDWFGDTLFNVLLFNLVLVGPGVVRGRPGRGDRPGGRGRSSSSTRRCFRPACASSTTRLADGELWSIGGFLLGWLVQFAIAAFAYRLTRARQMVRQYPWLYQRKGLLGWEERH